MNRGTPGPTMLSAHLPDVLVPGKLLDHSVDSMQSSRLVVRISRLCTDHIRPAHRGDLEIVDQQALLSKTDRLGNQLVSVGVEVAFEKGEGIQRTRSKEDTASSYLFALYCSSPFFLYVSDVVAILLCCCRAA
jgi:hypothetical protein